MKKINKKGFTLIELLAVIVILGLLMAIAIPSVTRYITQSRKKTLASTIDQYITDVATNVNEGNWGALSDSTKLFFVPVSNEDWSCVKLEKGGSNPFGNWKENQTYVVVHYDANAFTYDYYFTFIDDAGYGMPLTLQKNINANMIKNPLPSGLNTSTVKTKQTADIKGLSDTDYIRELTYDASTGNCKVKTS